MAQRRMFSRKVTDSDVFTDMPLSAQCLYFHIAMAADDDGFVDGVNKIRRSIGASEDDLKLLFAKSFLIPFESGVVVIRQWHIHNYIQKDRYTPTTHTEEMARLTIQEAGEKGAYALVYEQIAMPIGTGPCSSAYSMDTKCIHDGYRQGDTDEKNQTAKVPVNTGDNKNVYSLDTNRIRNVSTGIGKGIELGTGLEIDTELSSRNDNKKNIDYDNPSRNVRANARTRVSENAAISSTGAARIGSDGNWRRSARARAATAQAVVDSMAEEHLQLGNNSEIFDIVYEAMEHGVPPAEVLDAARQLDPSEFMLWLGGAQEQMDKQRESQSAQDRELYEARRRAWEQSDHKSPQELERLHLAYSVLGKRPDSSDDDDFPF